MIKEQVDNLAEGFMGMRFRKLTDKKQKISHNDIEFLFRVSEWFEKALLALRDRNSFKVFDLDAIHNYQLCLELMPKVFGYQKIENIEDKIIEFIDLIKNTLDLGEIEPKLLLEMRRFFVEVQTNSIHQYPRYKGGCF